MPCSPGCAAPSAKPVARLIVGIFDEQATLGNPDWAFPQYDELGVEALRVNLYWGGPTGVARERRPAHAVDPADPAYDWSVYDAMVKRSQGEQDQGRLLDPLDARLGRPGKNRAPRRMLDLRNFAYAAAKRYSGSFRPVTDGTAVALRAALARLERAEQPGLPEAAVREDRAAQVSDHEPGIYAKMCNAIWSGVHLTGLAGEKVACGATAPRGNNSGTLPRPRSHPFPSSAA